MISLKKARMFEQGEKESTNPPINNVVNYPIIFVIDEDEVDIHQESMRNEDVEGDAAISWQRWKR